MGPKSDGWISSRIPPPPLVNEACSVPSVCALITPCLASPQMASDVSTEVMQQKVAEAMEQVAKCCLRCTQGIGLGK